MKALIRDGSGKGFSTMKVQNLEGPKTQSNELKIRMVSSRINPVDMDLMKGFPFLKYKHPQIGGIDGAGTVIEVGSAITNFSVGDRVAFYRLFSDIGTWAEEITIPAHNCAIIPHSIETKQAGAIALPLLTAYESLMQLNAQSGSKILIHGIGGGVGFQALQIAKKIGLYVIGTGSQKDKAEAEKSGLDLFIDYQNQDFSKELMAEEIPFVFDTIGGEVLMKSIALKPQKIVSVKFVNPSQMHKAGVKLPAFMKWIMKLMMGKFTNFARRNKVQIIGQVTGANGAALQQAFHLVEHSFVPRNHHYLQFSAIEKAGLNSASVGSVMEF